MERPSKSPSRVGAHIGWVNDDRYFAVGTPWSAHRRDLYPYLPSIKEYRVLPRTARCSWTVWEETAEHHAGWDYGSRRARYDGGYDTDGHFTRSASVWHHRWTGAECRSYSGVKADGQIKKRGAAPLGGGQIIYKSPIVRQLETLNITQRAKIKKIRGVSWSTRVSPQFANRMVEAARGVLNRYVPDVYLYTDVYKGEESGRSPGYGLTLVTDTAAAEGVSVAGDVPEDLALQVVRQLLEEVAKGGAVDGKHQWLVLLLMVLGKEDVGRCLMGRLTEHR